MEWSPFIRELCTGKRGVGSRINPLVLASSSGSFVALLSTLFWVALLHFSSQCCEQWMGKELFLKEIPTQTVFTPPLKAPHFRPLNALTIVFLPLVISDTLARVLHFFSPSDKMM